MSIKDKPAHLVELIEQSNETLNDIKQLIVRQNVMIQGVLSELIKKKKKK